MSITVIKHTIKSGGVLVDPTTVLLSDPDATYGLRRTDTDAVVVSDGTAFTKISTGLYSFTFTDPAPDLTYEYYLEYVLNGETHHTQFTATGGTSTTGNLYDLKSYVTPYLPGGVTDEIVEQQLRFWAREFARKTEIWKVLLDEFLTT